RRDGQIRPELGAHEAADRLSESPLLFRPEILEERLHSADPRDDLVPPVAATSEDAAALLQQELRPHGLGERRDGRHAHVERLEPPRPFRERPAPRRRREASSRPSPRPAGRVLERDEIRQADGRAEAGPELGLDAGDREEASVLRRVEAVAGVKLVRHEGAVAHHPPRREVLGGAEREEREASFVDGHRHRRGPASPLPLEKAGQDGGHRGPHPARDIRDLEPGDDRPAARVAVQVEEARRREEVQVVGGLFRTPKTRDADLYEPRIPCGDVALREREPPGGAGPERVNQHVGAREESVQRGPALRRLQVEEAYFLAARREAVVDAESVVERRKVARGLAPRRLHLDDLRAQVGEKPRGDAARQERRHIDDADSREGTAEVRPHPAASSTAASPWARPPQIAASPRPPPRRRRDIANVPTILAPEAPTGCPMAMAPPSAFVLSRSAASAAVSSPESLFVETSGTAAKASLISTRSREARGRPARTSAPSAAAAGPSAIRRGASPTAAYERSRASG